MKANNPQSSSLLQKQIGSKSNNRRGANSGMNSNTLDSSNKAQISNANNDETWKKLEDLINIGRTDERVSLKTLNS
jgi:hypothetical protein